MVFGYFSFKSIKERGVMVKVWGKHQEQTILVITKEEKNVIVDGWCPRIPYVYRISADKVEIKVFTKPTTVSDTSSE